MFLEENNVGTALISAPPPHLVTSLSTFIVVPMRLFLEEELISSQRPLPTELTDLVARSNRVRKLQLIPF